MRTGSTGLAILVLALRRFGVDVRCRTSRAGSRRATACRSRRSTRRSRDGVAVIVTVDSGSSSSVAEIAAARDARHRRHRHRPPPASRPSCRRPSRSSTRIAPIAAIPDRAARGQRRRLQARAAAPARRAGGPRPSSWRTSRRSARSPTSPRSSARTARSPGSGLDADAAHPRPGIAALLERRPGRARPTSTSRRSRSPSRHASTPPGGSGRRSRPPASCWPTTPPRPARMPTRSRPRTGRRRDLMKTAVAEARDLVAADRRTRPATIVRGPWPVGIVGLVASRLAEDRGRAGDRRRGARGRHPRVVPERRPRDLGAAWSRAPTCSSGYGGHAGAAGFEIAGGALARVRRAVPGDRRGGRRRRIRGPCLADRPRPAGAATSTTRLHRELAALAPCGTGNPEPLVAVLGLTVTRVRAGRPAATRTLTLRRDRDVLDGIAFGRPDIADTRPRGRRHRRRGAAREPQLRRVRVAPARDPRRRARAALAPGGGRVLAGPVVPRSSRCRPHDARAVRPRPRRAPATRTASGRSARSIAPGRSRSSGCSLIGIVTLEPARRRPAVPRRQSAATAATAVAPCAGRAGAVERGRRAGGGARSRARSCTPRPATSGSRPDDEARRS